LKTKTTALKEMIASGETAPVGDMLEDILRVLAEIESGSEG
jgi:hypothetical protein